MNSFHRTKRDSRVLGFFIMLFILCFSTLFMLISFHNVGNEGRVSMEIIFGIVGVAIFVIFLRGSWILAGGTITHVFSIDENHLVWGFLGKVKQLDIADISRIYWDDYDTFTLAITKKDGSKVRLPYIANVVSYKSHPRLLKSLQTILPDIPIEGCIDKKTRLAAAELR